MIYHAEAPILSESICELYLPTRVINHLEYEGIHTVRELVQTTAEQMLSWRGFGKGSLRSVRMALAQHGLMLAGG